MRETAHLRKLFLYYRFPSQISVFFRALQSILKYSIGFLHIFNLIKLLMRTNYMNFFTLLSLFDINCSYPHYDIKFEYEI